MKKLFSYLFLLLVVFGLVACGETNGGNNGGGNQGGNEQGGDKELVYAPGTELNMAVTHDGTKTSISFQDEATFKKIETAMGSSTLADGKTYALGDLKPVWAELENVLNVKFNDVLKGNKAAQEFTAWLNDGFVGVDVVVGNASDMSEQGKQGQIIDLSQYLEYMPNFRAFLEENPIVKLSIVSDTESGAIYYAPYFDGYNDIEKYFLMRVDWVQKLLDGEGRFAPEISDVYTGGISYQPYMPTSGTVKVDGLSADGAQVVEVVKDYSAYGNIVARMNAEITAATNGADLVNMLRDYIDEMYAGKYGTERSRLFVGHDAAWDADELVALLRCVVANTQALTGQNVNKVTGLFPRETKYNRISDLYSLVSLFGVRGNESRNDYLYFDAQGQLTDARQSQDYIEAIDRIHDLYAEGLILQDYHKFADSKVGEYMYKNNAGFMLYDYCQTQCLWNDKVNIEGFNLSPVINPVAKWFDGSSADGVYMRFTESWRSVKTNGWCIPATVSGDKLQAALKLFDYMYSDEGNILMSFGPEAWRDGDNTITYKGTQQPKMSEAALTELWDIAAGNYTNYARYYLGSTLPIGFVKNQAMEYQCTTVKGQAGAEIVGNAIAKGIIKHVTPEVNESKLFYTMVPTTLPTTPEQDTQLATYSMLGADGFFARESGTKFNIFDTVIRVGLGGSIESMHTLKSDMFADSAEYLAFVAANGGSQYIGYKKMAWLDLLSFYKSEIK